MLGKIIKAFGSLIFRIDGDINDPFLGSWSGTSSNKQGQDDRREENEPNNFKIEFLINRRLKLGEYSGEGCLFYTDSCGEQSSKIQIFLSELVYGTGNGMFRYKPLNSARGFYGTGMFLMGEGNNCIGESIGLLVGQQGAERGKKLVSGDIRLTKTSS